MRLHEKRGFVRVYASGEILGGGTPGVLPQLGRVLRHGDGVQIHDHIVCVELVLHRHPLGQRAQVVSKVK